jgi:predicted lipid-binding transport protein (Tim44 family)
VSLQNRGDRRQDRVVVRIEAKLHDYVEDAYGRKLKRRGHLTDTVSVREFWTLGKSPRGNWILVSIEQGAEGAHALDEQLVASPWSDEETLRDEAMIEQAAQDALPDDVKPGEVASVSLQDDARAAALDLSLADGRFAPDVLEIAARRAVQAWAQAVDGTDDALRKVATPTATQELLHPGDPSERTRVVVRGPRVKQIRIARLDAHRDPPTMSIDVELSGRRYIEERDTAAVISGSQAREVSFTEHWVLELTGDATQPWRIASAGTALPA